MAAPPPTADGIGVKLCTTIAEMRAVLDPARAEGKRVGMVGTSGSMHRGHASLIERSASDNDVTALYWGGTANFGWMTSQIDYPRDADQDFHLAEEAGCDLIFAPTNEEFFPREPMTKVSLPALADGVAHLEDPAHLDLIAMVMCRMWNMFGPCRSYFGEKDWQQLAMYKRLADDLFYPIEVVSCPTVREEDGLAVSSRNRQLSSEERAIAPLLYRGLLECSRGAQARSRKSRELAAVFAGVIGDRAHVRYFTPVEAESMRPLDELSGAVRLLASIELGSVRLLDNIGLELAD